jgi:hypothetical protein
MQSLICYGQRAFRNMLFLMIRDERSVTRALLRPQGKFPSDLCYFLSVNKGSAIAPAVRAAACVIEWCQTRDLAEEEMSRK